MNYAEDRLDRKARHSNIETLGEAHKYLKEDDLSSKVKGHELAGKTLRDAGLSPQATFHYGMAWLLTCSNDEYGDGNSGEFGEGGEFGDLGGRKVKAVGDYAQMVELAGFPEVAVLSLLYHRLGGRCSLITVSDFDQDLQMLYENEHKVGNIFCDKRVGASERKNCGCGMAACGLSPCFIPSQFISSPTLQDILNAFGSLESYLQHPSRKECHAADILEAVSRATRKKNPIKPAVEQLPTQPIHIPPQLQFWKESQPGTGPSLSHLLQLLLTKILYSAPIGSSFLILACEAIRHLSISLPVSSALGRRMAQSHKSHWAYYILIYKVVLGERIKKHRRNVIPYHYPIWDIIHSLDGRDFGVDRSAGEVTSPNDEGTMSLVDHLQHLVQYLHQHDRHEMIKHMHPICLPRNTTQKIIYAIGDSHVLSLGWQTLTLKINDGDGSIHRTIVPCPITGLKAWHTRDETPFFTKHNLDCCLQRLPKMCRSIILSAGEIDCREGIGGSLLEGYYNDCNDAVKKTVKVYIEAVTALAKRYNLQILLMPVAPHAYRSEKNGKAMGRGLRRQRMLLWNETLRELCPVRPPEDEGGRKYIFLLDYEEGLRECNEESPVGFVLNKYYNADFTHMNSAFLPLLEQALVESKCDMKLL